MHTITEKPVLCVRKSQIFDKIQAEITSSNVLDVLWINGISYKINPFLANVLILYPLKTPENLWFPGVPLRYKMATLASHRS